MDQPGDTRPGQGAPEPPPTAFGSRAPRTKEDWKKTAGLVLILAAVGWGLLFGGRWLAGEAVGWLPYDLDRGLGEAAADSMVEDSEVCTNPELLEAVGSIVAQLESGLDDEYKPLKVHVVQDEAINAFCLPGGYIFVLTGILDEIERPEELIGVLGHEIGHAVHRHGMKRIAKSVWFQFLISQFSGGLDIGGSVILNMLTMSFDRDQERQSDTYGLELMNRVGYSARGFPDFFDRLPDHGVPEWLSTHPDPGDRAEELRKQIEALSGGKPRVDPPPIAALKAPCHRAD
ncbi:MAG: putative Zn-dependent protease [Myxococcota bacterium]|jgi:predicted Zn-dependent protease